MLTQERLKQVVDYDPDTGIFYRKISTTRNVKVGDIAGTLESNGYIRIMIDNKRYQAHHLAWFYTYGEWPKSNIDHINTTRNDNRISNLREDTGNWNSQNITKAHKDNKLGILGVYQVGNKFCARIGINKKSINLGYYSTAEEAHAVYLEAKRKYHPGNTL